MKLLNEEPNLIILTFQTAHRRGILSLNISEFCFTQKCEFVWRVSSHCFFLVHNSSSTDNGFLWPKERQKVTSSSTALLRGVLHSFVGIYLYVCQLDAAHTALHELCYPGKPKPIPLLLEGSAAQWD